MKRTGRDEVSLCSLRFRFMILEEGVNRCLGVSDGLVITLMKIRFCDADAFLLLQ